MRLSPAVLAAFILAISCSDAPEKTAANSSTPNNLLPDNNGFPAATGLTVYTGNYDTNNAEAYVFLGDGSEFFQKVDNDNGVASFPNAQLPQDVHIVLRDFGPGPDGQFDTGDEPERVFANTIAGYDANELWAWVSSGNLRNPNSGDQEFTTTAYVSGTVSMEGLQTGRVVPITVPEVWYALGDDVTSFGNFDLQMRGKIPSPGSIVAYGEAESGARAIGVARDVTFSEEVREVGDIPLDIPFGDQSLTVTTPNEAPFGFTSFATLEHLAASPVGTLQDFERLLVGQEIEHDGNQTTPFSATFDTLTVTTELDEVVERLVYVETETFDLDPLIQTATATVVVDAGQEAVEIGYLEPLTWLGPSLGTQDVAVPVSPGPLTFEWEPSLDGTAVLIQLRDRSDDPSKTTFNWTIWASPRRGTVTLPALPAEIIDVSLFPPGNYSASVVKREDRAFGSLIDYWQPVDTTNLTREWREKRTTEIDAILTIQE